MQERPKRSPRVIEYLTVVRSHLGLWIWLHRRRLQSRARMLVAPFVPIP